MIVCFRSLQRGPLRWLSRRKIRIVRDEFSHCTITVGGHCNYTAVGN